MIDLGPVGQWLLENLGPYGLAAFLCWYIINTQNKRIDALEASKEKLQTKLTDLMGETNKVLTEFSIRLQGGK